MKKLVQKMDAALAELPLDVEAYGTNYNEKAESLSILHQYVEGTYTIFPTKELEQPTIELSGHQMSMFDYLDTKAYIEPDVVDMQDVEETEESVLDETEEETGEIEQSEIPETPVETAEK